MRSSPFSSFKIISTLIGLKTHVIESENSMLFWNGTEYPINEWNRNITLADAFQSSCIWYFNEVIDKAGQEAVHNILLKLSYGNCDISQWEGSGTNAGGYNELNGFWLESSLLISPREQVNALIEIFNNKEEFESFIPTLMSIMLVKETNDYIIYGKTGTGSRNEAWFIGFAKKNSNTFYFAIKIEGSDSNNVTGQTARDIAINIIEDYF